MFELFNHHRFLNFQSPYWDAWEVVYDTPEPKYPPYDIDKDGDNRILTFAVAGFKKEDIAIKHDKRLKRLTVSGGKSGTKPDCNCECTPCDCSIKRGISKRPFQIDFAINEAKVTSSKLEDGILTIVVEPVPPSKDEVETIEIQ